MTTVALHRLQPDREPKLCKNEGEQIAYSISGEVEFQVGEDMVRLGEGGMVVIPSNGMH